EVAAAAHSRRQVAAQQHEPTDAAFAIQREQFAHRLARGADARQVRRDGAPLVDDLEHRGERLLARDAARAVGDAVERGLEARERVARDAQFLDAGWRVRRKELEADRALRTGRRVHPHALPACCICVPAFLVSCGPLRACRNSSRFPSPPTIGLSNQSCGIHPALRADASMRARSAPWREASRTMPRRSTAPGPSSNCGFTSASRWACARASEWIGANACTTEMN